MKYYKILPEINPEIIGQVQGVQSEEMTLNYDYASSNSVWEINKKGFDFKKLNEINLDSILLKSQAKITDFINPVNPNSSLTITANLDAIAFIKKFNLPKYKIVNCGIVREGNNELIEDYFLFGLLENQFNEIDFSASKFVTGSNKSWPIQYDEVAINSSLELKNIIDNISFEERIEYKEINFNNRFDYDLFGLYPLGGFFVSSQFKISYKERGLTGIRFEEAININVKRC